MKYKKFLCNVLKKKTPNNTSSLYYIGNIASKWHLENKLNYITGSLNLPGF